VAPPRVDPKVRALKDKADQAYTQRKWDKALKCYQEALERMPYDGRIGQRIGELYSRLNQEEEAVAEYKRAAHCYAQQGFWAKAIAVEKLILEIRPNDYEIKKELADMYSAKGKTSSSSLRAKEEPKEVEAISLSDDSKELPASARMSDEVMGATVDLNEKEPILLEEALGTPVAPSTKIPFLSELASDELAAVLERLAVRRCPKDGFVFEEGDVGSSMFIISEGIAEVSVKDRDGTRLVLAHLRGGEFFGEFSLLTGCDRQASVAAKGDLELLEITMRDFDTIANRHPRIWSILEDYLRKRMVDLVLSKSSEFRSLQREDRERLAEHLTLRRVSMDEVVMEEQTPGEDMFFVKTGTLVVTVKRGKDRVVIGELGPGDYFGEVAMLTGKPRTATVSSKSDCELFCLSRKAAAEVLRENRETLELIRQKMESRASEAGEAFRSYQESRSTFALT
jgi:cAMP-dependent protein kinase regulator